MIKTTMQWTCVLGLATLTLAAQSTTPPPVRAQTLRTFGIVGLGEGQTARLNLLHPGGAAPGAAAVLCSAAVSFIDAQGTVLKSATVTVAPGQSTHFDVDSDADLKLAVDERHEIRATILVPPVAPPPGSTTPVAAPCRLIPTLEIFDTLSGKTTAILGRAHFIRDDLPATAN